MLVQYVKKSTKGEYSKSGKVIRKPVNVKKGVMVAVPYSDKEVRIGWSLCAFNKGDKYDQKLAIKIALGRALSNSNEIPAASMLNPLTKFINRATRYYKDKNIKVPFPMTKIERDGRV